MQILESKLNYLTIEELDMLDPDPFKVVINKLLHISTSNDIKQLTSINILANSIANIETKGKVKNTKSKNIYYNKKDNNYRCLVWENGKTKHIKTNKDKAVVEKAYNEYISRL